MTDQKSINSLLKWGIENSARSAEDSSQQPSQAPRDASRGFNPKALAELFGGPSDADLMRDSMAAIVAPIAEFSLEQKLTALKQKQIAWDNFMLLVENLDNANNIETLELWLPLLQQLENEEPEMRKMAALSVSAAVQNNIKTQQKFLEHGGVEKMSRLALEDDNLKVRQKAVLALSSAVRNFQPALTELEKSLPDSELKARAGGVDAGDMDAVDKLMQALRNFRA